jgi:hypothetical protein
MKGASEELWATTMKAPSKNRVKMMGRIHQRRPPKKENNSPAVLKFRVAVRTSFMDFLLWKLMFPDSGTLQTGDTALPSESHSAITKGEHPATPIALQKQVVSQLA